MWEDIKKLLLENKESIVKAIKSYFNYKTQKIKLKETGNLWGKGSKDKIEILPIGNQIRRFLEFIEKYVPDCTITDTLRNAIEQNLAFKKGNSKLDGYIKLSNHQLMLAFDIVPYLKGRANQWEATSKEWIELHTAIMLCLFVFNLTEKESLKLSWGGFWNDSKDKIGWDYAHYEVSK